MMFNTGDLILDAVILSIVARTPEGTYGYKITQDVRSKMDVPESTFYPLLKQMQMDGYLEVYHKDLGGRSRRFYKITESGKERLEFCQQNWTNYLQNASSLLMGTPIQNETTSAEEAVPSAEVQPETVPVADNDFHIVSETEQPMDNFDFSIGNESSVTEDHTTLSNNETDLFELDINTPAKASATPVEIPAVNEQPEVPSAFEKPADTIPTDMDDEADFLAEMALGDAEETEVRTEPENPVTASENTSVSELKSLLSQLRSFETKMNAHREYAGTSNTENDSNINITDLNAVAALLNTAPQEQSADPVTETAPVRFIAQSVQIPDVPDSPAPQPEAVKSSDTQEVAESQPTVDTTSTEPVRYEEFRNPDTDESVNSLVELLKDEPVKKSGFFKKTVAKASSSIKNKVVDTANAAMEAAKPSVSSETVVSETTEISQSPVSEPITEKQEQFIKYAEVRNPDTDDSVNSLVDLLKNDQPAPKARFFKPRAPREIPIEKVDTTTPKPESKEKVKESAPKPEIAQNVHKISLTEVRNPETDEAVNSLVDLLKDDSTSSKPRLFRAWGGKSSTTNASVTPEPKSAPAAEPKPVEKVVNETPAQSVSYKETPVSENDAVSSLVDLLKTEDTSSKPKFFKPRAQKAVSVASAPDKEDIIVKTESISPVTKQEPAPANESVTVASLNSSEQPATTNKSVREVSDNGNSVDSLVELLKGDKAESKPVSIFGKASAKPYTKPAAQESTVSEPRVFEPKQTQVSSVTNKPATAKTFEAKAASPNARPVETRATITKPLEAKAISTKPTVAKPAEAKSVETKAVVTPKVETAKPNTSPVTTEKTEEEIPMDSFKYRLMQAHLLPEQEK